MRIGTSTHSWQFAKWKRRSSEHIMKRASDIGLDGVEIFYGHIEHEEDEDLMALKRRALNLGLDIYCLESHQNFVDYRGYVSIEHEGKEIPEIAVQKALELLATKMGIR